MSRTSLWIDAMSPDDKADRFMDPGSWPVDENECRACYGYGHFRENGEPTVDTRERKCGNCGGTGKAARSRRGSR